jgi:patatin-like phospholipase/acyl hydrolase
MTKLVLSLDGGGVRGAASARFLERLEQRLERPLNDAFDLFAGTSTGAIIAGALGVLGMSAAEISPLYSLENIQRIMDKSPWDSAAGLIQAGPKYDGVGKRRTLERYFGNKTLGEARKRTLIVTYDLERRESAILKRHHPEHRTLRAVDVIDASSAAPLYFPTVRVDGRWLIDGGVVANNPTLCAYAEAVRCFPNEPIRIVSVGTGKRTRKIAGEASRGWGAVGWITHDLLGVVMDETVVEYQAQTLLGEGNYVRVNSDLDEASDVNDDLDETSSGNLAALKRLGDAWFERFGAQTLVLIGPGAPNA